MTINTKAWTAFVSALGKLDAEATRKMADYINKIGWDFDQPTKPLIDFAYGVSAKYGDAAAALACEMYDAVALASGAVVDVAEPAETATYSEVAKAVNGTAKTRNIDIMTNAVGRLVKMAGTDTTMKNAIRDGAEKAWIPMGGTCAFCITLASRGWERASASDLKDGHTKHIHANCDCTFGIRFDKDTDIAGYDNGKKYLRIYQDAPLDKWNTADGKPPTGHKEPKSLSQRRINAIRREQYEWELDE